MVTVKSQDPETVFVFKDTHPTVVNAIRRTILDDVPTMAIESVDVVVNQSPLYDEILSHRLGLIPLTTDLSSYNFKNECSCGGVGCALCEVKLAIKADKPGYVYSEAIVSEDPAIAPADKEIPVTKLFGEKQVEVTMKAVLGTGREHAKWAPAHAYMQDSGKDVALVVEPFGQLDVKEVYNKALDVLAEKIDALAEKL